MFWLARFGAVPNPQPMGYEGILCSVWALFPEISAHSWVNPLHDTAGVWRCSFPRKYNEFTQRTGNWMIDEDKTCLLKMMPCLQKELEKYAGDFLPEERKSSRELDISLALPRHPLFTAAFPPVGSSPTLIILLLQCSRTHCGSWDTDSRDV